MTATVNRSEIEKAASLMFPDGERVVHELRAPGVKRNGSTFPRTLSGYFDDRAAFVEAAASIGGAPGVFATLNPVNPALLSRAANRLRECGKGDSTTGDADAVRRQRLLIDIDPVRPAGISATDAEVKNAGRRGEAVRSFLRDQGWPTPLVSLSGNGFHLVYRVDLPSDDGGLIRRVLLSLAELFNDDAVKVDTSVHNAARIAKLPGTVAAKGDDTPDRPHRTASIRRVPVPFEVVSEDQLHAVADLAPRAPELSPRPRSQSSSFDLARWIDQHDVGEYRGPEPWSGGRRRWVLSVCPFNSAHDRGEAFIAEMPSGAVVAGCQHASCTWRWQDLRESLEPGCYSAHTPLERTSQSALIQEGTSFASFASFAGSPSQDEKSRTPVLADEAYHGIVGEFVRAVEPHTEACPAGILVQALVAAGNVIGRGPHVTVESDKHHANLYACLVGSSSKGRKGTSFGRAKALLEGVDPAWVTDRILSGASSGEGLIWAVRDPVVKDDGETVVDEGVLDKRLLVMMPEFAVLLKVLERQGNTLSARLREAWDSGDLNSMTKTSPAKATGAHVSMIGHITDDELRRYMTATETANGFANRILWCFVQRSKLLPEGGNLDPSVIKDLGSRLLKSIQAARTLGEVGRTAAFRKRWREIYTELAEDRHGLFGAVTSRAEAQVLRLALLYALLDGSSAIDLPHLQAGYAVWQYCEESARLVFGDAIGDPLADEVLQQLRDRPGGMTRTEISAAFSRHKSKDRMQAALALLKRMRKADFVMETSTGGRPTERWVALSVRPAKEANKAKEVPGGESSPVQAEGVMAI